MLPSKGKPGGGISGGGGFGPAITSVLMKINTKKIKTLLNNNFIRGKNK